MLKGGAAVSLFGQWWLGDLVTIQGQKQKSETTKWRPSQDQDSQDDVARLESERGQVVKWGRQKPGGETRGNTCFVDPLAETQAPRSH